MSAHTIGSSGTTLKDGDGGDTTIGCGYNSFTGDIVDKMLDVKVNHSGGVKHVVAIYVCESVEDVLNKLDVDVTAHGSGYGVTLDNKFHFAQEAASTTTSVVVLVVASSVTRYDNVEGASFFDKNITGNDLYLQGGDSFVCNAVYGAQFYASLEFICHDATQMKSVSDDASTTFSVGSFDASAGVDVKLTNFQKIHNVQCRIKLASTGYKHLNFQGDENAPNIVNFALGLPAKEVDAPDILSQRVRSYHRVGGCPEDFKAIEDHRKALLEGKHSIPAYQTIEDLAKIALNTTKRTAKVYAFYGQQDLDGDLSKTQKTLDDMIGAIQDWKSLVDSDPTSSTIPAPDIDLAALKIPSLQFDLDFLPQLGGGTDGDVFSDVGREHVIGRVFLKRIEWRAGDWMNQVTFTYGFDDGRPDLRQTHGSNGGGASQAPITRSGFSDLSMVGAWSVQDDNNHGVIQQFEFKDLSSDSGSNTLVYKDKSSSTGTSGRYDHADKGAVKTRAFVGFSGRHGEYLNGIAPIWAVFQAPRWTALDLASSGLSK